MHGRSSFTRIGPEANFHSVLGAVTSPNFGIIPIQDENNRVIGSISDGDLRRALLARGGDALSMTAEELMTKSPKTVLPEMHAIEAIGMMEKYKITAVFVASEHNELLGLVRLHDLLSANVI
jgi:arabinose-5-phosphate isomerase